MTRGGRAFPVDERLHEPRSYGPTGKRTARWELGIQPAECVESIHRKHIDNLIRRKSIGMCGAVVSDLGSIGIAISIHR